MEDFVITSWSAFVAPAGTPRPVIDRFSTAMRDFAADPAVRERFLKAGGAPLWTTPEAMTRAEEIMRAIGQSPIVMSRELDGFVMNRLQGALLEEAFRLVADGFCTVEDVDVGLREGLALRWSFIGPFETIDLNAPGGVRDYVSRYGGLYERLYKSMQRRADWTGEVLDTVERQRRERTPADKLADRQRWRDRRLMALSRHKRKAAADIGN